MKKRLYSWTIEYEQANKSLGNLDSVIVHLYFSMKNGLLAELNLSMDLYQSKKHHDELGVALGMEYLFENYRGSSFEIKRQHLRNAKYDQAIEFLKSFQKETGIKLHINKSAHLKAFSIKLSKHDKILFRAPHFINSSVYLEFVDDKRNSRYDHLRAISPSMVFGNLDRKTTIHFYACLPKSKQKIELQTVINSRINPTLHATARKNRDLFIKNFNLKTARKIATFVRRVCGVKAKVRHSSMIDQPEIIELLFGDPADAPQTPF